MTVRLLLERGEVDLVRGELSWTRDVRLTSLELELLRFLAARAGECVSRETLLKEVWGYRRVPRTRSVDHAVSRLRRKLERDRERPRHLLSERGVGYRLVASESESESESRSGGVAFTRQAYATSRSVPRRGAEAVAEALAAVPRLRELVADGAADPELRVAAGEAAGWSLLYGVRLTEARDVVRPVLPLTRDVSAGLASRCLGLLAELERQCGADSERVRGLATRALAISEGRHAEGRGQALKVLAALAFRDGLQAQGDALVDTAIVAFREAGSPSGVASALARRADAAARDREPLRAVAAYEAMQAVAEQAGLHYLERQTRINLSIVRLRAGGVAQGLRELREALRQDRHKDPQLDALAFMHLGVALGRHGQFEEARSYSLLAAQLWDELGDPIRAELCRANAACELSEQGRPDQALEQTLACVSALEDLSGGPLTLGCIADGAWMALRAGDVQACRGLLRRLQDGPASSTGTHTQVRWLQGVLEERDGDLAGALEGLQQALAGARAAGDTGAEVGIQLDLARVSWRLGQCDAARQVRSQAEDLAEAAELRPLLLDARAVEALTGPRSRAEALERARAVASAMDDPLRQRWLDGLVEGVDPGHVAGRHLQWIAAG